jgi:hypothetical protein
MEPKPAHFYLLKKSAEVLRNRYSRPFERNQTALQTKILADLLSGNETKAVFAYTACLLKR